MSPKPTHILIIEDDPEDVILVREALSQDPVFDYSIENHERLQNALERLSVSGADIVLLDLSLPDSRGMDTFTTLMTEALVSVPVIILTSLDDEELALRAVQKGAQDYLVKGRFDGKLLSKMIRYAIERHRLQAEIINLSMVDPLTELYNRRGFYKLAEQHLKLSQRTQSGLILIFADLDGLKKINDTYGHPKGDEAIAHAANVFKETFRTSDILARLGGDEFAIVAVDTQQKDVEVLKKRVDDHLKKYNDKLNTPYKIHFSLGCIYVDPSMGFSVDRVMQEADAVLYAKKRLKKERQVL